MDLVYQCEFIGKSLTLILSPVEQGDQFRNRNAIGALFLWTTSASNGPRLVLL